MEFALLCGEVEIPDSKAFLQNLQVIGKAHGATIQPLNADLLAGRDHVARAWEEAEASRTSGAPLARDAGMELLLHVSGQSQIFRALEFGVAPGRNRLAVVVFPPSAAVEGALREQHGLSRDCGLADYRPEKRAPLMGRFRITEAELETVGEARLPELVAERVALLALERRRPAQRATGAK